MFVRILQAATGRVTEKKVLNLIQIELYQCIPVVYFPADPAGNANDHGWDGDASQESDSHRSSYQSAQLPEKLLLSRPGLLSPESAAGWTQVVQVRNLFHAEPAELGAANSTRHVVA